MIDPETVKQFNQLDPITRPLLVCDVDEVILHLVAPFEQLLEERGMELRKKVIKLNGNVFHKSDGSEVAQKDIWAVLDQLFKEQAMRQAVVEDAANVLGELSRDIDIILLTNLPHEYGDLRRTYLGEAGIPYPVVTNSGVKGPAIQWLDQQNHLKTAFMDDTFHHLESVSEHTPETFLVHFMADDEFRTITKPLEPPVLSTGNWREAGDAVRSALS